jgi:hypothetical protein
MSYFWLRQDWLAEGFMAFEGNLPDGVFFHRGSIQRFQPQGPLSFTTTPVGHPVPAPNRFPPHLEDGAVPAMSERFCKAVCSAGVDNLQVWPAIVRNPVSNRIWKDYYAFNVLGLVDVVNLEASVGTKIMEGETAYGEVPAFIDLKTIVLKKGCPQDLNMFREPIGGNLIVGHRVVDALERMRPPEGWGVVVDELEQA